MHFRQRPAGEPQKSLSLLSTEAAAADELVVKLRL